MSVTARPKKCIEQVSYHISEAIRLHPDKLPPISRAHLALADAFLQEIDIGAIAQQKFKDGYEKCMEDNNLTYQTKMEVTDEINGTNK